MASDFYTSRERVKKFAPAGSHERDFYSYTVDEFGVRHPFKTKTVNVQDQMNAEAKSCDITTLLTRYANGDTLALNQRPGGASGDFRFMPENPADFQNPEWYHNMNDQFNIFRKSIGFDGSLEDFCEAFPDDASFVKFVKTKQSEAADRARQKQQNAQKEGE